MFEDTKNGAGGRKKEEGRQKLNKQCRGQAKARALEGRVQLQVITACSGGFQIPFKVELVGSQDSELLVRELRCAESWVVA